MRVATGADRRRRPARTRSALDLLALTPVFDDQSGRHFGAAVVGIDLTTWIDQQMAMINRDSIDLTITDEAGKPLLFYEHGEPHGRRVGGPSVAETIPATRPLFGPDPTRTLVHDGTSLYAVVVALNPESPDSPCRFGIVAQHPGGE